MRRLAAILAADVVGYGRLMGEDETATLAALKAHREVLIDPTVAAHNGRLVKLMGDGALVEFGSVVDAVACAADIQRGMAARNADVAPERRIELRIGINLGDVIVEGDDIYGDGVNVAARLETIAEPGGVCVSAGVHEQVREKLDFAFEDIGDQTFKNIARPVRVYRMAVAVAQAAVRRPADGLAAVAERPSIAVLPFANMSRDSEWDFLADGISEDLITGLSKVRWFLVIARNSTFTYKGRAVDVKTVAGELGVRYVLEGSVRTAGKRVRVTAQLIDAATGLHVWAERYDREIEDIFELQDEMTQTIVGALEPELGASERARAALKPPENLGAWETYQRALWHLWTWEREEHATAIGLFRRAVEQDPNFAPAHAYESYAHYISVILGWAAVPEDRLAAGTAAAQRALACDDREAVAYFAAGRIQMLRGEHDASIASLETAIALNPSFAQAYHGLGFALALAGRLEESKEQFATAVRLSPRDPLLWAFTVTHGLACILSHDYQEALHWGRRTLQIPRATGYWPHAVVAGALSGLGRIDEAKEAVQAALEGKPDLTLAYLEKTLPTREPGGLAPWLDALRAAGLPE